MKEVGEKFKRLFDPNSQLVWLLTRLIVLENLIEEEFFNSLKDFQLKLVRRASETTGMSSNVMNELKEHSIRNSKDAILRGVEIKG
jgi:hypothetical protein